MMDFELTKGQLEAIDTTCQRYIDGKRHVVISGPAGSGKTAAVNVIINKLKKEFGIKDEEVVYASYTGKASLVLRKKGNKNVKTLHKLLYIPQFNQFTGEYNFIPKGAALDANYRIIVVDECSMVPNEMVELLAKTGCFIIFLGDSHQLPPVSEEKNNYLLDNPHVKLTEIVRQAEGSEIIQIATKVREGEKLTPFKGNNVQIIRKDEVTEGMLLWADQILCSTNQMRREINTMLRDLHGYTSPAPQVGDKVICLHNYWGTLSASTDPYPLMNGTIGKLITCDQEQMYFRKKYWPSRCYLETDNDESFHGLLLDTELFETGNPTFDPKTQFQMKKSKNWAIRKKIPLQFDYGYAITVHKSQGSEFDKVLLFEENFPFTPLEHQQSLYTGITRAREKLIIVLKD